MVVVAQLVRASGCGPEGRGFESPLPPHFFQNQGFGFCVKSVIAESNAKMPVSYWLRILLNSASETKDMILTELINKGIVKVVDEKYSGYLTQDAIIL